MKKLTGFAFAGGVGYAVDLGVLHLMLRHTPLDAFSGRVVAIASAMTCAWLINRTFTFGASGRSLAAEGARYGSVGMTAAAINFALYSLLLIVLPDIPVFVALTAGSATGTAFAYLGYSRFVFGSPADPK